MKTNLLSIAFCTIISLFLYAGKANASIKLPITDSVCCAPDSLTVKSANYPLFCVGWRISTDSTCFVPYGFTVQWRAVGTHFWREKTKIYTSGSTQTFCDTVTSCVPYEWRVRTICDSAGNTTYSDWVYGPNINFICSDDFNVAIDHDLDNKQLSGLTIIPSPATSKIIITTKTAKTGDAQLRIVNSIGKNILAKILYVQNGELKEQLQVGSWQKGIYFITITSGSTISKGSFLKQ